MVEIIEKYIQLMEEAINVDILTDKKATTYNKITKKLWGLQDKIILENNYQEVYREILNRTNDKKYRHIHYDIAESLYIKDKLFTLDIYKMYKGMVMADSRIQELEAELIKEGKLTKEGFFGRLFK